MLAAGTSQRWGTDNKLLTPIDGKPMVRRTVEAVLKSGAEPVIVVTGHQADAIRTGLAGLPVAFVHAPDYAAGMSASLKAGIAAVPADCAGVLVCLGDMPFVRETTYRRLMGVAQHREDIAAILPTFEGQRGNPVVLGSSLFPLISGLSGDQGARKLLAQNAVNVKEIAVDDPGVLRDVDRPEMLRG